MLIDATPKKHSNPVYAGYFADPFVWKHKETWYAIGTGESEACGRTLGKVFPVLQSSDFFTWQFASNALIRPDAALGDNFWAPAVAVSGGRFYLYYSVGHGDKNHQLRVAVAEAPQGPYEDTGIALLNLEEIPFAIDPHPFEDSDGHWYLFYSRDFLDAAENARAGTALAATRMKSMTELEGAGVTIQRASADWQRFEANRAMYGGRYDWHTLEGPAVWKHDGLYYCFYSGGRWENDTYGVDYCTAESILGPYQAPPLAAPRVLRTVADHVIGPGHNTLAQGPDGQDYIAYHAWDKGFAARRMFISKLEWTSEGPRVKQQA